MHRWGERIYGVHGHEWSLFSHLGQAGELKNASRRWSHHGEERAQTNRSTESKQDFGRSAIVE